MKRSFRIFSILLVFALIISAFAIPASAAIPPQKYGDTNSDSVIDIIDATNVQRYLAKVDLRAISLIESADVDSDAKITILDATIIQRYVAKEIFEFPAGEEFYIDKYFYGVTADYDKDKAIANFPVTFSVDGYMSPSPATASLYIDDVLVAQTQERNEETHLFDLVYTFEEAGEYKVEVTLTDKWGYISSHTLRSWSEIYTVKDAPADTSVPVIAALSADSLHTLVPTINVNVKFGTAPYQYKYTLYENSSASNYDEIFATDFIDSNTLNLADSPVTDSLLEYFTFYRIKVEITDANGKTAVEQYEFRLEPIKPA